MAQRRMFSLSVIGSDAFLEMPLTTQALYFHLGMRADDDGFISSAKTIMRTIGANQNDYDLLVAKGFVIAFKDGIVVVKHWRINNYIQKDAHYHETEYVDDKKALFLKANRAYTLDPSKAVSAAMDTKCIQNVSKMDTESSVVETRLDKIRQDKINVTEETEDGSKGGGSPAAPQAPSDRITVPDYKDPRDDDPF